MSVRQLQEILGEDRREWGKGRGDVLLHILYDTTSIVCRC